MTRLIALCSPAMASGKSTVAEYLVTQYNFTRIAFASPLKRMAVAFFDSMGMDDGETQQRVYGTMKEEPVPGIDGLTSRRLQQLIGTELGRDQIGENVWVDITRAAIQQQWEQGRSVVIDDMRFTNEAAMIESLGGMCIRVRRPGFTDHTGHVSEGQLDAWSMPTVLNDSTIKVLTDQVDCLLSRP